MVKNNDSIGRTLLVVLVLCLFCSVIVAGSAVGLKSKQEEQKALDKQSKILEAAGLMQKKLDAASIKAVYNEHIEPRLIELKSGDFVQDSNVKFDLSAALKDNSQSDALAPETDVAGIRRVSHLAEVYLVKDEHRKTTRLILPVYGNGLWSVMYAFIAVDTDGNTVRGLTYYDHGETPGLGGEIENPSWQQKWHGKKLFDEAGSPAIRIVKGEARAGDLSAIDGISGSTLTTNGVQNTFVFWLGDLGYGPFLKKVREGVLKDG